MGASISCSLCGGEGGQGEAIRHHGIWMERNPRQGEWNKEWTKIRWAEVEKEE